MRVWPASAKIVVSLVVTIFLGLCWLWNSKPLLQEEEAQGLTSRTLPTTLLSSATSRATWLSTLTSTSPPGPSYEVLSSIFERHCKWTPPRSLFELDYNLPALARAALEHCPSTSSLPFAGVDVWLDHADVRLVDGHADPLQLEMVIDQACNDPNADKACVIFTTPPLLRSSSHGAAFLLRVLQRPFILITANNEDECSPYPSSAHAGAPLEVDDLLRSPLLLRWYAKNPCLHEAHLPGHKLRALPIGPKWQFKSTAFHGEDSDVIRRRLVDAGADDPQGLFTRTGRAAAVYVAMVVESAAQSWYLPARGIRQRAKTHLDRSFSLEAAGADAAGGKAATYTVAEVKGKVNHATYLHTLASHAFTLSPPGRGLDAHRTWEALLLGCIPIVWHSPLNPLYEGLPVVVVQDPRVITPAALAEWDAKLRSPKGKAAGYRWQKLFAFYWLGLIEEDRRLDKSSAP